MRPPRPPSLVILYEAPGFGCGWPKRVILVGIRKQISVLLTFCKCVYWCSIAFELEHVSAPQTKLVRTYLRRHYGVFAKLSSFTNYQGKMSGGLSLKCLQSKYPLITVRDYFGLQLRAYPSVKILRIMRQMTRDYSANVHRAAYEYDGNSQALMM